MGEQKAREAPGERRLADPFRSADDPGLRQLVAAIGVEQFALRRRMAEERQRLARMRRVFEAVAFRVWSLAAHCAACAVGARKRASNELPDGLGDVVDRRRRVDDAAALRLAFGDVEKGLPQLFVKAVVLALETVGALAPPRRRAAARAMPSCGGRSRMMVRSGRVSPTAAFSSSASVRGSTPPRAP